MAKDSRTDHFFSYPKNNKGKYTGHTICILLRNGEMYEGVALCSEEDHFNKKKGRELALSRALEAYTRCQARREKKKPTSNKTKVSHYESKAVGYANSESTYEVKRKLTPTTSGFAQSQKLSLRPSRLDSNWSEKAFENKFDVQLDEDGNGVMVAFDGNDKGQYLDYSQLHNLYMALHLFYGKKPYKGYEFKRVK